jgi:mannose-6-phosphate isomerase-like protein (cupin superfamily)
MAEQASPMNRNGIVLAAGEGRTYPMGRLSAVFKADGAESAGLYSISEWWLDPRTPGPGPHAHPEDDVFYVIGGTVSFLVGDGWVQASTGAFVLAPRGVTHDFENRSMTRAGFLNISVPGDFEPRMPEIAEWLSQNGPI